MKSRYFYSGNKRCLVTLNEYSITIHPENTPNLQTVIKLNEVLDIKLCTCAKIPTKLLCACVQSAHEQQQLHFRNVTLTRPLIDGDTLCVPDEEESGELSGPNFCCSDEQKERLTTDEEEDEDLINEQLATEQNDMKSSNEPTPEEDELNDELLDDFIALDKEPQEYGSDHMNGQSNVGCVRLFYSTDEGAFCSKVKCENLLPEALGPEELGQRVPDLARLSSEVSDFVRIVRQRLQEFKRPKSLLLFINPIGGRRRAPIIYRKLCQPLFSLAGVRTHAIFTRKANHAYELLRDVSVDLTLYDAIGCVGGDGMFSELLNGILRRFPPAGVTSSRNSSTPAESDFQFSAADNLSYVNTTDSSPDTRLSKECRKFKNMSAMRTTHQTMNRDHKTLGTRNSLPVNSHIDCNDRLMGKRFSLPVNSQSTAQTQSDALPPLLLVPAGSTDAVAYGSNGINDPQTVLINFILGKQIKVDVAAIHSLSNDDRLLKYCCSFLGYGYFGDILRDSEENLRWMGTKRYDWAGLKKFFLHRVYKGELRLKVSRTAGDPLDNSICVANCELCSRSYIRSLFTRSESENTKFENKDSEEDANNNDSATKDLEQDSDQGLTITTDKTETGGDNLVNIRGRFLAINAATMSCRCGHSKYGISPAQHIGNGCCDLIVVGQCTRKEYLKYLLRTGFSEKSAFDLDFVNVYRVNEFEFTPSKDGEQPPSVWNCDGEILREAAIRVKVYCQLISVFGGGIEVRPKNRSLIRKEKHGQTANDLQKRTNLRPSKQNLMQLVENNRDNNNNLHARKISTGPLKLEGSVFTHTVIRT